MEMLFFSFTGEVLFWFLSLSLATAAKLIVGPILLSGGLRVVEWEVMSRYDLKL